MPWRTLTCGTMPAPGTAQPSERTNGGIRFRYSVRPEIVSNGHLNIDGVKN